MVLPFLLAGVLATTACTQDSFTPSDSTNIKTDGDVKIVLTSNNRVYDLFTQYQDFSDKQNMSPNTITLDPTTTFQTMDGFGAAITGSTCYNLLKMNKQDREQFLTETFSQTEGIGMSYIRIAIGCSDFSLSEYTCWDTPGEGNFALQDEELNYIIPILKEILAINPDVQIIGSPWTSPKWMKVNNLTDLQPHDSWTDGQLNPKFYQDYGSYFVKWLQAFAEQGIHVMAITPQNEPLNRGNSASLYMSWQEQQAFIAQALGPKLRQAGLDTKIYAFDHNYNYDDIDSQNDYPINIYNNAQAAQYLAGAAYHNYGGDRAELLDIHQQRPDKEIIFTETSIGTWNDGQNLSTRLMEDMQEVALGTINNWSRAVIVWNLMLDSDRGPNRAGGCQTCYGAVDINSDDYKSITRNSHYYIIGHLSAVVKPGATRIAATGYAADGLTYTAFQNLDGSYALVALNNTNEVQKLTVSDGTHHFSYDVPVKSVASYQWK
ncbi:glycoside hydrolase family 30 beta sandwich domain-containing protein [Sphingobacterium sp. JB170]|uniref:glycoside hydrolase family 30 protein n=1 Tax=Sphingobacterium sp. JB170 TaxID=1434842 RepID=UPI00097EFD72|nr:glycoside hydrolase family 30 beta sandwich domain-containing protein [Sphingobacterium sp. JB170]SJN28363.1 glycoside hydrolase family 30, candidate beta-glycosidase [Sphingobacterium sp. JB170]